MAANRLLLDKRLAQAFQMAKPCPVCADIGADHGQLSAALLQSGKAEHMLVADISDKSLSKARIMLKRLGLDGKATFAVADGLRALDALPDGKAHTVFILGMGGETLSRILRDGASRLHGATLILGAQTDLPMVRQTLCDICYRIRHEAVVEENKRSYILMACSPADADEPCYDSQELYLGPVLLKTLPPLWQPMLERHAELIRKAVQAMTASKGSDVQARLNKARQELEWVQEALERYDHPDQTTDE